MPAPDSTLAPAGRRAIGAVLLVVFAAALATARAAAARLRPSSPELQLEMPAIPADVARPLAFGFRSLLADLTFLEAIQLLSLRKSDVTEAQATPIDRTLAGLLNYTVDVDPLFAGAYRFAGAALPHETVDHKAMGVFAALQILEKGARSCPDDWHIFFLLGFLQSYYLGDVGQAAHNFARAAQLPGSPAYLGFLATRLGAASGDLEVAMQLAATMAAQVTEDEARKQWEERLLLLRMERDLRAIEAAVQRYREETGRVPRSLADLLRARLLTDEPREPHGGRYRIADDGSASSTAAERLRVYGTNALQAGLEVH